MRKVFDGIERKFRKECRRNAQGHRSDANRVTIRRRFCTLLRSDISAGTGSIVRNELLRVCLAQYVSRHAPEDVRWAGRWKRDDHSNGFDWILLSGCVCSDNQRNRYRKQKSSHSESLINSCKRSMTRLFTRIPCCRRISRSRKPRSEGMRISATPGCLGRFLILVSSSSSSSVN